MVSKPVKGTIMVVSEPTVSGVVLLVPQHLHYFCNELIPNLSDLTTPFDEVLVIASGLSRRQTKQVEEELDTLSNHPKKRVLRVQLGSVGANRNHGLNNASSDLVTFLDSDDLYSPDYCAFLKSAYEREPYQVLLHGYHLLSESESDRLFAYPADFSLKRVFYSNQDFLLKPFESWESNPRLLRSTTLQFRKTQQHVPAAQGHMTVSTKLSLRFHEDPVAPNEDGVFIHQCLAFGHLLQFYPVQLSAVRPASSARPLRYRILRLASALVLRWSCPES